MKRKFVLPIVLLLLIPACSTIFGPRNPAADDPIYQAEVGAKMVKDAWTTVQQVAAVARINYEDSIAAGVEPEEPYLDNERWATFKEVSAKVRVAQALYIDSIQAAKGVEGDPATIDFYVDLIQEKQSELMEVFNSARNVLDEFGIKVPEVNL